MAKNTFASKEISGAKVAAPESKLTPSPLPQTPLTRRMSHRRQALWKIALLFPVMLFAAWWSTVHSSWYYRRQWALKTLAALIGDRTRHADNPTFLYYLGKRFNEAHRFDEAAPVLEHAVGLDPDTSELREEWARALLGSGRVSIAFVELRQFVGTHPRSGKGHIALGKFYLAQHTLESAITELQQAATLEPSNGEAWSYLGTAKLGNNDAAGARPAAEKAAALLPQSGPDQLQLAMVYAKINLNEQARRAFEKATQLSPELPNVHRQYAGWLIDHPKSPLDIAKAEAEARSAIALDGNDSDAHVLLGRVLVESHHEQEAIAPLERAAALDPLEPVAPQLLKQIYNRQGNVAKTQAWGDIYLSNLKRQTHRAALLEAISVDPKNRKAQRELARALAEWGDVLGCLRHMAFALDCPVDAPPVLLAAARDLIEVGHADEALRLTGQVLSTLPADPAAHEMAGDAWLALAQVHKAAQEYELAAQTWTERRETYRQRLAELIHQKRHSVSIGK